MKQVITINRKKYATGLFWQPVDPLVTPYVYARQLASKSKKKYNLLTEYKGMVGLADSHDGAHAGMVSGASAVVGALGEFVSFLGVFQIGTNYYLIAVRNGVIIRDILLEKESEARKMYAELSNLPDWGGLFAPASWGMPRSQEKLISDVIKKDIGTRLRQMSIVKAVLPSVILVVIFLIGAIYFIYSPLGKTKDTPNTAQLNPELAAEYQKQLQKKNEELDKKFNIEKKPIEYPYDKLPYVMDRAYLCYKATGFMMQSVTGWNQKGLIDCGQDYISASFYRDFGTLNDFYIIGADLMPGGVVSERSENEISVSVKLPELKTHSSIDERDQETALRDIRSVFQQANMKVDVKTANEIVRQGVNRETLNIIEVSAKSKLVPMQFVLIFKDFGGVYLKSVDWDTNDKTWGYKVLIYTK